jgi:hypothetical protein
LDGEMFLQQPLVKKFRQRCIIFSDKDAHQHTQRGRFFEGVRSVWLCAARVSSNASPAISEEIRLVATRIQFDLTC